jgi:hypothetical protein
MPVATTKLPTYAACTPAVSSALQVRPARPPQPHPHLPRRDFGCRYRRVTDVSILGINLICAPQHLQHPLALGKPAPAGQGRQGRSRRVQGAGGGQCQWARPT